MLRGPFVFVVVLYGATCVVFADDEKPVDFGREIRPILEKTCWKCHGPEKQQGGLRLDRREEMLRAGDSGEIAVSPGKIGESELLRRLESADPEVRMPANADPLARDQIGLLRRWIEQGAKWPESTPTPAPSRREMVVTPEDRQHWSFLPLRIAEPPGLKETALARTPIDHFVFAALEAKGLVPNRPADRRTLIRRVYLNLVGLPPTPEEVESFLADPAPDAYEMLVDRLLASPHYGERWGRHWLDVARYADSGGLEGDSDRPTAYHYRDFVIRAFNEDLAYQSFVRWQLAGDEYEPDNPAALAATGFLTAAPNEVLNVPMEEEKLRLRYNELDDMAATTAAAFLGLTLGCARCHDHKFDAIPTRDYYRLQCAFIGTARSEVPLGSRDEVARQRVRETEWTRLHSAFQGQLKTWLDEHKKPFTANLRTAKIEALPIPESEKTLLREQPDADAAKKLVKQHEKALALSDEDYRQVFSNEERREWDRFKTELDAVARQRPRALPTALAITDAKAEPQPTWLLDRGDFYAKKEPVSLGFLTVLSRKSPEDFWKAAQHERAPECNTYQRRAVADWITDVDHGAGALLARVLVNRVWQHHFGAGLSRTPNDFGVRGERPSHPELLEWLAHDFVKSGWKLKRLHRSILTSAVYQQDTAFDEARSQVDPENRLLWRRRPQRLEAEILRDTVLAISGTLNSEPFGPGFKPPIPREAIVARNTKNPYPTDARDTPATRRRTVYMFHKRVVQHPVLQAFDGPDAATSCGRRNSTTVAPQALALLNDPFFRDRAQDLATRLLADAGASSEHLIDRGFLVALSRGPTADERTACVAFLEDQLRHRAARDKSQTPGEARRQALADFCQMLFSLNEFLYVD